MSKELLIEEEVTVEEAVEELVEVVEFVGSHVFGCIDEGFDNGRVEADVV